MVRLVEIPYRPAVRDKIAVKAPFFQLIHKITACTGRLSVDSVVCAHDSFDLCLFHKALKRRKISFVQILFADACVEAVACLLGSAVRSKMLCAGGCQQSIFFALYTVDVLYAKLCRKIRVFAVGLLSPSPAWVTEDVDVGRPDGDALEFVNVARLFIPLVFGTGFNACYLACTAQKRPVKSRCKPDSLREKSGDARTGKPVQALVPPVVCRHAKTLYRLGIVFQLARHFLNGHFVNKCFGSFLCRQTFIKVLFHIDISFFIVLLVDMVFLLYN